MSTWMTIVYIIVAAGAVWMGYTFVKGAPKELFSKVAIHKSIYVMGILTLGLIIFIWILVKLLQ